MWLTVFGVAGFGVICRISYAVLLSASNEVKIDVNASGVQKAIRSKKKLRERHLSGNEGPVRSGVEGLPDGNFLAKKWVVLDLGNTPNKMVYDPWKEGDEFKIKVFGVEGEMRELSVGEMKKMGVEVKRVDWHCVTGWSACGLGFSGVSMDKLVQAIKPREDWKCLWQVSADGYTAPILRADLEADTASFIALGDENEQLLPVEHGGVRIVCPSLFGWKSAKYLTEIHFLPSYQNGFWEKLGCHQRGRAMLGERWTASAATSWQWLVWMADLYRRFVGPKVYWMNLWIGSNVLGWFSRAFGLLTSTHNEKK